MDRRAFLRSSCLACAGIGSAALVLSGCASLPVVKAVQDGGMLHIPLTAFADATQVIVRHAKLSYDIAVMKLPDGGFRALYLRCSHEDQPLSATAQGLHCTSHGSRFGMDGIVLNGPATAPLLSFPTTVVGSDLLIRTNNS